MDYLGSSTTMYLLSKAIFHKILYHKIDIHDTQQDILTEKVESLQISLKNLKNRENFSISESLREEFESKRIKITFLGEAVREDWANLSDAVARKELSPKDMVVLNLYFTFMGVEL